MKGRQRKGKNRPNLNSDCLNVIFNHFRNDKKSLLSCILVCRLWSLSALPLYWENPFEDLDDRLVIATYISCLELEDLSILTYSKCDPKRIQKRAGYNYAQHLKNLSMETLYTAVNKWLQYEEQRPNCRQLRSSAPSRPIVLHITRALYRLLLNEKGNVQSLSLDCADIKFGKSCQTLSLKTLKDLSIHYTHDWPIFKDLVKSAVNIQSLEIIAYSLFPPPKQDDEKNLAELITNQNQLKKFKLFGYGTTPTNTISAITNAAKTLTSVEIIYCHFNGNGPNESPSLLGLAACNRLEELVIRYCTFANDVQLVPLATASFPALRKLHFVESTYHWDETMVGLIRNNASLLEEVFFKPSNGSLSIQQGKPYSTDIVQVVSEICPWVETLGVPIGLNEMSYLRDILNHPRCNLRSLSLFPICSYTGTQIMDTWPSFGPLMPTSLRHLNVCMKMNDEPMQLFLETTRAPLETLWFDGWLHATGNVCLIVYKFLKKRDPEISVRLKQGAREFLKYVV
ncbi:hypothetical protein G9A89_003001 [Geosiphon pyriformis]|nr:hypothetical protein G9A89_003001 [Geosiphon pyriformis]